MVPVLVDGDVVLSDEYEIIDYLKKTYPVES
jgi:glutathione S-transferase